MLEFLNVCRHRGLHQVNTDTSCEKPSFACPYHNWVYDLQGNPTHIPRKDESFPDLDPYCHSFKQWLLDTCEGLIFVNPDANRPD